MNADVISPSDTPLSSLDKKLVELLNDPRDLPFLQLMLGCCLVMALGVGMYFAGPLTWWLALPYWAVWGLGFLDRFILMLHCTSHRQLFRREHRGFNQLIPWVIGPFFGETPETYFAHHMGMHHPENNLADDLSSTMKYRRDSVLGWLHYYFSFLLLGLTTLFVYHLRHGNKKLAARMAIGELSFYLGATALMFVNWRATLIVMVVPLLAVRLLMMAGNWGQHAFVDATDPGNAYKNSITCINTRYNRRCFNDGYHILHHIRPRTHFTEYPLEFEENRAEYGKQDAIVFEGIDFFQVWAYLMLGRWRALASRFVRLPGAPPRSDDEVILFLKSRTQPIAA